MKCITFFKCAVLLCALVLLAGCQAGSPLQVTYKRGAVAADHEIASIAGVQMLALGGNAVDAAVAASFTLSVVRPYSCGIGGGGFMVIHLPNDPTHGPVSTAINYRETAYVDAGYYERTGKSSTLGGAAVAIPGTVSGLLYALEQFGTLDRETVLAPAMEAAQQGFRVDHHYYDAANGLIETFNKKPEWKERFPLLWALYLNEGEVAEGDLITNPQQHRALGLIAKHGRDGFTGGELGAAIVKAIKNAGGEMTIEDLSGYEPLEYSPLSAQVNGKQFISMPPPSSGGVTMIETLKILEATNYDFDAHELGDNDATHVLIEALKHSFADRSMYLADPEFIDLPIDDLLDVGVIHERAQMITDEINDPSYYGTPNLLPTDGGTSHVSVVDPFGGAVACTETINLEFGSLVGVDGFGFMLNNEMDDFTTLRGQPNAFGLIQSDRNLPAKGKRPLSSMSPTIVLDENGELFAIAGASGGPKIITGTLQALLNAMAGMSAGEAMAAPRIHHQWLPDHLSAEGAIFESMQQRSSIGGWNKVIETGAVGNVQIIVRDPDGNGWQAACDLRKGGRPAGVD
jgi:gamma-glutamyltranspeptidase/glutathione hydrolase